MKSVWMIALCIEMYVDKKVENKIIRQYFCKKNLLQNIFLCLVTKSCVTKTQLLLTNTNVKDF